MCLMPEHFIAVATIYMAFKEISQIIFLRSGYFSFENLFDWSLIVSSGLLVVTDIWDIPATGCYNRIIGAYSLLISWMLLILKAGDHPYFLR